MIAQPSTNNKPSARIHTDVEAGTCTCWEFNKPKIGQLWKTPCSHLQNAKVRAEQENKPSAFLTRREATLNHLVKQIALLDLESLTALGAVLLDAVDARAEAARLDALVAAWELKEWQEA